MLINLESIAEDYCSTFSDYELISVKDDGVDLDSLRDWMESELEEEFDETDVEQLNEEIMSYAEFIVNERKQEAASELRSTIEVVISDQCSILEDYEIASILADYVSGYLQTGL